MNRFESLTHPRVVEILQSGGVGVIRTDTLYGLVARADSESAVARVYDIKTRTPSKPPIVLIASRDQMFDPAPDSYTSFLDQVWPGPTSVIMPAVTAPDWLTRGSNTVAYRVPHVSKLRELIEVAGPLIAPSANPEGDEPAMTIEQAVAYFGEKVDFYVDGGEVQGNHPSALYRLDTTGDPERLR